MSVFDLPRDEFMAMLPELEQQGFDTYDLLRRYREHNSVFSGAHRAAGEAAQSIEEENRRPVVGGLFSKERGTTGRNALASMRFEPRNFLANVFSGGARAVEAPAAAAQGLIPQQDMALEALGTAGMAMTGGGAVAVPNNSLRAFALRGGGTSDPTQTGWTFRDVAQPNFTRAQNREINRRFDRMEWSERDVPIRSLYATQDSVNPDFATTTTSEGLLPTVVRRDGQLFIRDGHHRLTRAAEDGGQTARVALIDLDNADRSMPLFDEANPQPTPAMRAEAQSVLAELFEGMTPEEIAQYTAANADEATGAIAMSAADTPAKQMAQRILDLRAAGRASEVTDDMMAAADPVYLFDNYPLAMDQASRMQRARDMGFDADLPLYHATEADFPAFDMAQSWRDAMFFAKSAEGAQKGTTQGDALIYPAFSQTSATRGNPRRGVFYGNIDSEAYRNNLRQSGFNSAWVRDEGGTSLAVLDPANIRSRFARFDPEFSHLSNLSAANASTAGGATAMSAQGQPATRRRRNVLREMLR